MHKLKVVSFVFVFSMAMVFLAGCGSSTEKDGGSTSKDEVKQEQKAPAIPHVLTDRDNCLGCHSTQTLLSVPSDHQGRDNNSCDGCHKLSSNPTSSMAESIPHQIEGRENCLMCHASGTSEGIPSSHQGRTSDTCVACHQPGSETSQEQEVPAIPHVLTNRDNCLGCHSTQTLLSVPSDHQGRGNNMCTSCHKSATNPTSSMAEAIPHNLEGRENCLMCHASGTPEGIPSSHQGRTSDVCVACHQPK